MQETIKFHHKIIDARHRLGITQEELADLAKVNVRTIQRIEKGAVLPRKYTIKVLAAALNIPYQTLVAEESLPHGEACKQTATQEDNGLLQLMCLACFSYLIPPYVHFMLPAYILKKQKGLKTDSIIFGNLYGWSK